MSHSNACLVTIGVMALLGATACEGRGPAGAPPLVPVDPSQVCVESGSLRSNVGGGFTVLTAGMRAVAGQTGGDAVEIAFTYQGPSQVAAPLASGELRRQIGLKLRAQDTCNVVYVMWHVAPTPGVYASIKRNPGQSTHDACGDRGYINLQPTWQTSVPPIQVHEPRTLSARIDDEILRVSVDGALAWEGTVAPEGAALEGPVGVRSDNGDFDLTLLASRGSEPCAAKVAP